MSSRQTPQKINVRTIHPQPLHPLYQSLAEHAATLPEPRHCYTMAKPSGSVCNLDCHYCFYLEKERLYPERQQNWRMDDETLSCYIEQQMDAQEGPEVVFSWQGGEPTLMGISFYEKAFEQQRAHTAALAKKGRHVTVVNTFQTNGIKIDDAWAQLFSGHQVLVGISIDGPRELHDIYRVKRNGEPTFDKVMAAIDVLKRHRVRFNTLTVVHNENSQYPKEVYEFLVSTGSEFLQFIPLVERAANKQSEGLNLVLPDAHDATVTPWSVGPKQFGLFLTEIFDVWVKRDVGRVFVQLFDSTLASHLGYPATLCSHAAQCGSNFAIEANGDVYACDHYVYPEHKLGNVHSDTLLSIRNSVENRAFGLAKTAHLNQKCLSCAWRFACHGGCPKHRFVFEAESEFPVHYLCPSYAHFFSHTNEKMTQMAALILRGKSPVFIMK